MLTCCVGWARPSGIKQYLPFGHGIARTQRFCIESGGLNATNYIRRDCHFFRQLVVHTKIIYKNLLLPYDPGGIALWLDKIAGISESRLFIIGLRASRISREGECNTPAMGCHRMKCYLGLEYEMGQVPRLYKFGRCTINIRRVNGNRLC